jgi:phage tail-like protein
MPDPDIYAFGFHFVLHYGTEDIGFQEISGISEELSVEEIVGGGENRFKYKLPNVTSSQNLSLKRALVPESSKLVDWCKKTIGRGLAEKVLPAEISVSLLDHEQIVCMKWTFHKAYPVKYAFSDLKSQENALVIESIDLAYTYFDVSAI